MKSRLDDKEQRYLLIFKKDATNLFDRIKTRSSEYIETFSLKRNRAIFKEIFSSRYENASALDLSYCPLEIIEVLDQFYTQVDALYWYLKTTQDMPNTIEDELSRKVAKIERQYKSLCLFIDAELSGKNNVSELGELDGELSLQKKVDEFLPDFMESEFVTDSD